MVFKAGREEYLSSLPTMTRFLATGHEHVGVYLFLPLETILVVLDDCGTVLDGSARLVLVDGLDDNVTVRLLVARPW